MHQGKVVPNLGREEEMTGKSIAVSSIILVGLCVAGVSAQKKNKPDFTGTWLLDESKSVSGYEKLAKKKPVIDPKRRTSNFLIIKHADPEFAVTSIRRIESFDDSGALIDKNEAEGSRLIFYTDRRGETNLFQPNQRFSSKSTWDGKSIFVVVATDKKRDVSSTLKFTLSADGKELTVVNFSFQLNNDATTGQDYFSPASLGSKKVYRKVDQ